MGNITTIEFRYERKHQPEQYGSETVLIGGTANIEDGEEAFAIVGDMIGRAKALAYQKLGLKGGGVPTAAQQAAAPVVTPAPLSAAAQIALNGPDLSLPGVTTADIKAAATDVVPALPGEDAPKNKGGRPKGSGTGERKTRAVKQAEVPAVSDTPALPGGDETPLPGTDTLPELVTLAAALPVPEELTEEDQLMAMLNQGATPAPAATEAEVTNAQVMEACARAVTDKKADVVNGYLKQLGILRVLQLDQAQRRGLLALLAK